jgi:dipeptidyl aminopeptidase/acylaminoacyl peptidase
VSHANDELRATVTTGAIERMVHEGPDGLEIESFIVYPPNYKPGRAYPLAVNVHGGPHGFHPLARLGRDPVATARGMW